MHKLSLVRSHVSAKFFCGIPPASVGFLQWACSIDQLGSYHFNIRLLGRIVGNFRWHAATPVPEDGGPVKHAFPLRGVTGADIVIILAPDQDLIIFSGILRVLLFDSVTVVLLSAASVYFYIGFYCFSILLYGLGLFKL